MTVVAVMADPNRTQLRLAVLRQWIEAGLVLVRRLAEGAGHDLIGGALRLFRISQAIRLALALSARLSDPASALFQPSPARTLKDAAADSEPVERPETLRPERERLRFGGEPPSDAAILRRPLAEIIKVICAALGVTPDMSLWSDEDRPTAPSDPEPSPPGPSPKIPAPRPRPPLILERPAEPPAPGRRRARLRSSCAPLALVPLAAPASGRFRLPEA